MPSVLIVDSEPSIRTLLSLVFVRAGYEVKAAADPYKAMAACALQSFDAILSEIEMPGMDGHRLVQWVANTYPKTCSILMSGLEIACEECPVKDRCTILRKPFNPKDAIEKVAQMLNQRAD